MFGFIFHPQPVGRRRAVPELVVRAVSPELVQPGHIFLMSPQFPKPNEASEATRRERPIEIDVAYRLGEYLQVLSDYAPVEQLRRVKAKGDADPGPLKKASWPQMAMLFTVGSLAFLYKVNRVGACHFNINELSVERSSKGGKMEVPWEKVTSVLKLSGAYLVLKAEGGMPIPFRCMSSLECAEFERFAGSKLSEPWA